jgi:hypothetical protein
VAGQIYPHSIPYSKVHDPLAECVDQTGTVLVRRYLWERRRRTIARAAPRLPVGGVDAGDENAEPYLAWPRLCHIAINQPKNRRITGSGVDNRLHAYEAPILSMLPTPEHDLVTARPSATHDDSFIQRS